MFVVFQTSVAPFVQQVAQAFAEGGRLARFFTTIYALPSSGRIRRVVSNVPSDKITGFAWHEWIRLGAGRLDPSGRLADIVWEWAEKAFARKVAAHLERGITGIYGYEFGALEAFARARELGIRTIYDVPAPNAEFVHGLLERELEKFPQMETKHARFTRPKEERRTARRNAEWQSADVVITASEFTRDSYARAGRSTENVRVVPYGAPVPVARELALERAKLPTDATLRFIYAGTFGIRKGAHLLLDAWETGGFGRFATLDVFGSVNLPSKVVRTTPRGLTIHGPIGHDQLLLELQHADALLFPTLCDGFGMVATEAWSRGTPVITTKRAGVVSMLRPFENGLLLDPASSDAIAEAIQWCIDHPGELRGMRERSLDTAAHWQWSDYRRAIVAASTEK